MPMIKYSGLKVKKRPAASTIQIFNSFTKAIDYLQNHVNNTNSIDSCTIFTYGIYVGKNTSNVCYKLLNSLSKRHIATEIYVGDNSNKDLDKRIKEIKDCFGVKITKYSGHHKLLLFSDGWGYFGSCNFTGGGIGDFIVAGNLYEILNKKDLEDLIVAISNK